MDNLSNVPGLGMLKRLRLKRQGWGLAYMETIDFISEQNDRRPTPSVFTATMWKAINTYGGEDKVVIQSY
ncbi:MAG TPA: hypothetical protein VFT87_04290, partial [Candidatus Saccharimonadales bacterium]|nr:hypothetical protein [Candidatus Saccharimonadales bacterium]